jgi:hypothetical protein
MVAQVGLESDVDSVFNLQECFEKAAKPSQDIDFKRISDVIPSFKGLFTGMLASEFNDSAKCKLLLGDLSAGAAGCTSLESFHTKILKVMYHTVPALETLN